MKKITLFFIIIFFIGLAFNFANAEPVIMLGQSINVDGVSGFTELMVAAAKWILGITGSLALLAFIAGGAMWLISAGNPQMVERGKTTLIGAVIGLVIVFSSWIIIKYVTEGIGGTFSPGAEQNAADAAKSATDKIAAEKATKEANEKEKAAADKADKNTAIIDECYKKTVVCLEKVDRLYKNPCMYCVPPVVCSSEDKDLCEKAFYQNNLICRDDESVCLMKLVD